MSEGMAYNPYENHETWGPFAEDVRHYADMSLRHRNQEVTPENLDIESKRVAYDDITRLLGRGVEELRVLVDVAEIDIFSWENIQAIMRDMLHFTLVEADNKDLILNTAISYELRDDKDGIDLQSEFGTKFHNAFVNALGDLGSDDANTMQTIIAIGINTAARVIPAYWRMIRDNLPETSDFYEVARQDSTMNTLQGITRAWHTSEINNGLHLLGISGDSPADQTMNIDRFDITDKGVRVKPEYRDRLRTDFPDERVSCPAGHLVDIPNEHGEVERVTPIKEIATTILEAWHAQQSARNDAEQMFEDAV